ncbi:MAG TPA: SRPBCC family protein [Aeromicrobium sp.]|nr:SRPBCC family protein [Aeromicrobium sp.]
MELSHRFVVPAVLDVAWAAFNDPEGIAPCFPGATLTSVDGDAFAGSVKIKLGPISMLYNGTGVFVERDEAAHRVVIEAKGKDKRGNGTAGATVVAQLTADGTGTAVEVSTDLSITGKPAQFGRGVIQDISDKLLGQFVECIAQKLGPAAAEKPAATAEQSDESGAAAVPGPDSSAGAHTGPTEEPAELNLLSTVLPVLARRYALPAVIVLALIIAIWIWVKR